MTNFNNQFLSKFAVLAILLSLSLIILSEQSYSQGIGISNTAITPHSSAVLEMRSTNQGVLVPRMTTGERDAIVSPADGLMIYNTTTQTFNYFQGVWKSFSGVNNVTGSGNISSSGGVNPVIAFTGNLPVTNLNAGIAASGSTFWRGDGSWSAVDASTLTGNLLPARFNSGNAASTSTFWRGDGTWSSIAATNLTGILPLSNGGTGLSAGIPGGILGFTAAGTLTSSAALTPKALIIGGVAGATPGSLPLGSANQVLGMNGTASDHEYKTINGGSGIVVTNSPGSVSIANAIPIIEVSSDSIITIASSPTYALSNKMSITAPSNGDYMVWFSTSVANNTKNESIYVSLYNDVNQILASVRLYDINATGLMVPCSTQALLKGVVGGKLIELRWRVSGGTGTMRERTLTIMKVK